jgi:hypothetical protein
MEADNSILRGIPLCDQPSPFTTSEVGAMMLEYERIILALWDEVADIPGCANSFMRVFSETAPKTADRLKRVIRGREDERD